MLSELLLTVIGGSGGNGAISFRRERYVPRGGPDGGDGGDGGSVSIRADASQSAFEGRRRESKIRAEAGGGGSGGKRHGKRGKGRVLDVPVGTMVWLSGEQEVLLADLDRVGMELIVARGGKRGRGNARFATSVRRTPRIAERGLPGEERRLRLELRLLAEVGLVGLTNAGKSSLLRAMTRARPKVGAYPFTTLEAGLGVVELEFETFVVADIPGLMEGAHEGVGLGVDFLRQIQRTRVIAQLVDTTGEKPLADIETARAELEQFGHGLVEKLWIAVLNKVDLPEGRAAVEETRSALVERGVEVWPISALTGEGVADLERRLWKLVEEGRRKEAKAEGRLKVVVPEPARARLQVVRAGEWFVVKGKDAEDAAIMLSERSDETRFELLRRLRRMGLPSALRRAGGKTGARIRVGEIELEWPG